MAGRRYEGRGQCHRGCHGPYQVGEESGSFEPPRTGQGGGDAAPALPAQGAEGQDGSGAAEHVHGTPEGADWPICGECLV